MFLFVTLLLKVIIQLRFPTIVSIYFVIGSCSFIFHVTMLTAIPRFTEIYVDELKDTADLKTLVAYYLQNGDVTPKLVDGIVK